MLIYLSLALFLPDLVATGGDDAGTAGQTTGDDALDARAQQGRETGNAGEEPTREDATATEAGARPEPSSGGQAGATTVTGPPGRSRPPGSP